MRILLLNTAKGWGGLESHSIILARALLALGHEVVLGCRSGANVGKAAAESGIPTTHIYMRNAMDLHSIIRIVHFVQKERVDVLIANLGKEYWPATVAAKLAGSRAVFIRHQLDPLKGITQWLINNHVDKVIAVTHAVKAVMIRSGVRPEKIAVVHPGQNVERYHSCGSHRHTVRAEWGIGHDDIVVAAAGKLHPGKGIYELLEVGRQIAVRHPHLKIMYIGDGEERDNLVRRIETLGMTDRVIMTGYRPDIDRLLSAADIFVLPSKGYESFGMVLIEAMAAGKPVIGTNTGGIPEVITHRKNGLLVSPGSVTELAEAITLLIENEELCRQLVTAGGETVAAEFTDLASAGKLVAVLKEGCYHHKGRKKL